MAGITSSGKSPLSSSRKVISPSLPAGPTPLAEDQADKFRRIPGAKTRIIVPPGAALTDEARAVILGTSKKKVGRDEPKRSGGKNGSGSGSGCGGGTGKDQPAGKEVPDSHPDIIPSPLPVLIYPSRNLDGNVDTGSGSEGRSGGPSSPAGKSTRFSPRLDPRKLTTSTQRRAAAMEHHDWYVEYGGKLFMVELEKILKRLSDDLTKASSLIAADDTKRLNEIRNIAGIVQRKQSGRDVAAHRVRMARAEVGEMRREIKSEILFACQFGGVAGVIRHYERAEEKWGDVRNDETLALKDRADAAARAACCTRVVTEIKRWVAYVAKYAKYRGKDFGARQYRDATRYQRAKWVEGLKGVKQISIDGAKRLAEKSRPGRATLEEDNDF